MLYKKGRLSVLGAVFAVGALAIGVIKAQNVTTSSVKVQAFAVNGTSPQATENVSFRVLNSSSTQSLSLSEYRLRYWFSDSEQISNIKYSIWWYSLGSNQAVSVNFGGDSAQRFADITWASGIISPNSLAEVQIGINNSDWKPISNTEAYSRASISGFADNNNIALYHGDILVWGTPYNDTIAPPIQDTTELPPDTVAGLPNPLANEIEQAQDYAIWGSGTVRISDRVKINGAVASNAPMEIGADAVIYGDIASSDQINLRSRANITGSVRSPFAPQKQDGVVIGGNSLVQQFPKLSLSEEDSIGLAISGASAININPQAVATIAPGNYTTINIGAGATVTLLPGVIRAYNININPDVKFIIPSGLANTSLISSGNISIGDRSKISFANDTNPIALAIMSTKDFIIGTDCILLGRIVSKNGNLYCGSRTTIAGAIHGSNIDIEPDVKISMPPTLKAFSHSQIAYGPAYRPWRETYLATVSSAVAAVSVWAKSTSSNATLSINAQPNGSSVLLNSQSQTIKIQANDSLKEAFVLGSGKAIYQLQTNKEANYAIRINQSTQCTQGCDGSDWSHELKSLKDGIALARSQGKRVWIGNGTFTPGQANASFIFEPGIAIFGGFKMAVMEDETNRSGALGNVVLSGDNQQNDRNTLAGLLGNKNDNSRHVVKFYRGSGLPYTSVVSGVVVSGGYSSASNGLGAGVEAVSASPVLDYVLLNNNISGQSGAAIYLYSSDSTKITNSYISQNQSPIGAAISSLNTSAFIANGVIQGNQSDSGIFSVTSGTLKLLYSSIGGNNLGAGYLTRTFNGQILFDRSISWLNNYTITQGYIGLPPIWSFSDIQNSTGPTGWKSNIGIDNGSNMNIDPAWNSAQRIDNGSGQLLTENDGLRPNQSSLIKGSISSIQSQIMSADEDLLKFSRMSMTNPGAYIVYSIDPGDLSMGTLDPRTGRWYQDNSVHIYDGPDELIDQKLSTSANYTIRLQVTPQKHVGSQFYGTVSMKDETGTTVSSTATLQFYRLSTENGKWIYYSLVNNAGGTYVSGQSLLLVADQSLDGRSFPRVRSLFVQSGKQAYSLHVDVPKSQFNN
jgi:parallel beta-helix repeat protein